MICWYNVLCCAAVRKLSVSHARPWFTVLLKKQTPAIFYQWKYILDSLVQITVWVSPAMLLIRCQLWTGCCNKNRRLHVHVLSARNACWFSGWNLEDHSQVLRAYRTSWCGQCVLFTDLFFIERLYLLTRFIFILSLSTTVHNSQAIIQD